VFAHLCVLSEAERQPVGTHAIVDSWGGLVTGKSRVGPERNHDLMPSAYYKCANCGFKMTHITDSVTDSLPEGLVAPHDPECSDTLVRSWTSAPAIGAVAGGGGSPSRPPHG
jgi:hypothetical protein